MKHLLITIILSIATSIAGACDRPNNAEFVPVLAYHRIDNTRAPGMTVVSEARFTETVQAVKKAGYQTATVEDLTKYMKCELTLQPKTVVFTFDDGWKDQLFAANVLKNAGMKATFYVMSGTFHNKEYMTEQELKTLSTNFDIGSHSHTHFPHYHDKDKLELNEMVGEIAISKKILTEVVDKPITSYAWPYGYSTKQAIEYAKYLGMQNLAMINSQSMNRPGMSVFDIERINVYGNCSSRQIIQMIRTGKLVDC